MHSKANQKNSKYLFFIHFSALVLANYVIFLFWTKLLESFKAIFFFSIRHNFNLCSVILIYRWLRLHTHSDYYTIYFHINVEQKRITALLQHISFAFWQGNGIEIAYKLGLFFYAVSVQFMINLKYFLY